MDLVAFLWIALGVAISVVLPVLGAFIRQAFKPTASVIPYSVKKWGALFLFSSITGILLLAFYRSSHPDSIPWFAALIAGYTWDSTVQKITGATGG